MQTGYQKSMGTKKGETEPGLISRSDAVVRHVRKVQVALTRIFLVCPKTGNCMDSGLTIASALRCQSLAIHFNILN